MNEYKKYSEASYFLARMIEEQGNFDYFSYNLSAFLSAARSVLQYAYEEAKTKAGGQGWYVSTIRNSTVLTFFKGLRDTNIHVEPVNPSKDVIIKVPIAAIKIIPPKPNTQEENIKNKEILKSVLQKIFKAIALSDEEKNLIDKCDFKAESSGEGTVEHVYNLANWNGSENIIELSQKYLEEINNLIIDGQSKGFLTK